METALNKRNNYLDAIKGVLIFLVVLGHLIGGFEALKMNIYGVTHFLIYSVHMSMFVFISGYFSKKDVNYKKVLKNLVIPYVVFDLLYVICSNVFSGDESYNILVPTYVYWYILCIALMRCSIKFLHKTKLIYIIPIVSIVFCYFVSESKWSILAFGRYLLLLPIFYCGYRFNSNWLDSMRRKKAMPIVTGLLSIAVIIILMVTNVVKINSATHNYSSSITDNLLKYLFMALTIGIFCLLVAIMPNNCKMLNRFGKNSVIIYLCQPVIILIINKIIAKLGINYNTGFFFVLVVIAFLITYLLSLDIIKRIYDSVFTFVGKILHLN